VSKRSYRRLAVVAGAALAVGSMAPALAARVDSAGTADLSVDTVDVNSILGGQSSLLSTSSPLETVDSVKTLAGGTAFTAVNDVKTLGFDALGAGYCLVGAGTNAVLTGLDAGVLANAGLGVGLGGLQLGLGLDALAGAPLTLVDSATQCVGSLKTDAVGTLTDLKGAATAAGALATTTAFQAVSLAQGLPSTVSSMAAPLVLGDLLNISGSGNAAAMMSLF